jgi:tetratricopeptide (TPR) repeat protein
VDKNDALVDELAAAILDGSPIDWEHLDATSSSADHALIGELRLLSALVDLHRQQPDLLEAPAAGTWGHLHLLERVGGGSFGEVYRARDTRLEREVAVKLMPAAEADVASVAAIIREGRLLARVRHPGVVTVYDAQRIGDRVGLWMEFVRGQTLEQRLEQDGPCTPASAIDIGVELCRSVAAVHEAGLLHRDIKTQNVMRADDGRLVLMDFGVGRDLTDGSVAGLAGTPLYLAPEMFGGAPPTVRTDVYAIGVLLFRMLTGSFPVRARLASELQRAHQHGERQGLLQARPDLPESLAAVVERAIDPDPDRRFGNAVELGAALEALRPRVRSRAWWLAAAAALVLVAGAALSIQQGWIAIGRDTGPFVNPQQWIQIAEFSGTTGDSGLDAALRQAVVSELEASSYVNVLPASAGREGVSAFVSASIEARNRTYRIGLRATHAGTGRVVSTPIEERTTREETLHAAFGLGRRMRELLGESGPAIQAMGPPLAPVTTESFEARQQFALGRALYEDERFEDALPHFQAATRHDPGFAMAWLYTAHCHAGRGAQQERHAALDRAASLARDNNVQLGYIEREKILGDYDLEAERLREAGAHYRLMLSARPGDGRIRNQLGMVYGMLRDYSLAIEEFEAAGRTHPHFRARFMLADMYSANRQPDIALALLEPHLESPADWIAYAKHLAIGDRHREAADALAEGERRANAAGRESWADLALAKADYLRSKGRFDEAESALQQGLDRTAEPRLVERLELAMTSLLLERGRAGEAIRRIRRIDIQLSRNRIVHGVLAARAGDLASASAILVQLEAEAAERQAPRPESRVQQLRAEIALARSDARAAYEYATLAVKAFQTTWTLTTLARAQLAAGHTSDAIGTWKSILALPGERTFDFDAPAYSQYVLAWLELARLLEQFGRLDDARATYHEFLRLSDRGQSGSSSAR